MKVEVVEYDPGWSDDFDSERLLLIEKLQGVVNGIHHIGSTSVKNLAAKPIIDIMLEVDSLKALDDANPKMESLGYEAKGEYGIPGRRYFRKGGNNRTHQIHAFESGDENVSRHIAFRDYLGAHPDVMQEYAKLKVELANTCDNDIDVYCEGKDEFVKYHEAKAVEWSKNT